MGASFLHVDTEILTRPGQVRDTRSMRVFLMGKEDASVAGGDRWREYVGTYVMRLPTEWVPPGPVDDDGERIPPCVFLKR